MLGVALVISAAYLMTKLMPGLESWKRATMFAFAVTTGLYSYPLVIELSYGQPQTLILAALVTAAVFDSRGARLRTGLALGFAALVKTWPAALALWLLRRPFRFRWLEAVGILIGLVVAVGLTVAVDGTQGPANMFRATGEGSDQPNLSWAIWGLADFESLGAARWIIVGALALVTVALVITTLAFPGDARIRLFNLTMLALLLLSVSHYPYLLLDLPVLWWWLGKAVAEPRRLLAWVVVGVMTAWWVVAMRVPPASTMAFVVLVVVATVVAAAATVVGAARLPPCREEA